MQSAKHFVGFLVGRVSGGLKILTFFSVLENKKFFSENFVFSYLSAGRRLFSLFLGEHFALD